DVIRWDILIDHRTIILVNQNSNHITEPKSQNKHTTSTDCHYFIFQIHESQTD
ncbi:hypothetical protein Csa_023637, partial [Cucumis sativus]